MPHAGCRAFAKQIWYTARGIRPNNYRELLELRVSECAHCNSIVYWLGKVLISPDSRTALLPNADFSEEIKRDYNKATYIEKQSSKGAAALLRLCVQRLCQELCEPGKNINKDIAALVKKELPVEIQQALDVVRVIGSNAAHPVTIYLDDRPETVSALFTLVSVISDWMIA